MFKLRDLSIFAALVIAVGAGCGGDSDMQYVVEGCGVNFTNGPLLQLFTKCALSGGKLEAVKGMCTCHCPGWDDKVLDEKNYTTNSCPPFGETEIGDAVMQGLDMSDTVDTEMTAAEELAEDTGTDPGDSDPPVGQVDPGGGGTPDTGDSGDGDGDVADGGGSDGGKAHGSSVLSSKLSNPATNPKAAVSHASGVDTYGPEPLGGGGGTKLSGGGGPKGPQEQLGGNSADTPIAKIDTGHGSTAEATAKAEGTIAAAADDGAGFESSRRGSGSGQNRYTSTGEVDAHGREPAAEAKVDPVAPVGPETLFDLAHPHYVGWAERLKVNETVDEQK
ncbi:MAG: hypothetical protein HY075_13940 [Deltaproteobacteria bacterium]|nr:hypothetical protein [Deltaproteobacteria bacterium]